MLNRQQWTSDRRLELAEEYQSAVRDGMRMDRKSETEGKCQGLDMENCQGRWRTYRTKIVQAVNGRTRN